MKGRLILGGGGIGDDERPLFEILAQWIGNNGRLLYWPMAMPDTDGRHAQCLNWVKDTLRSVGLSNVTMWSDFRDREAAELSDYQAIFIGGGCTYLLLKHLKDSGFDHELARYFEAGGVIYGGSAGAIILGNTIETCAHMDRNICNLEDTTGLNFVGGYNVACHYHGGHETVLRECADSTATAIIALPERSGLICENSEFYIAGHEPAYLIGDSGTDIVQSGQRICISGNSMRRS